MNPFSRFLRGSVATGGPTGRRVGATRREIAATGLITPVEYIRGLVSATGRTVCGKSCEGEKAGATGLVVGQFGAVGTTCRRCIVMPKGAAIAGALQVNAVVTGLALNGNNLGEAGARALFRLILRGLTTFVEMRNCTFPDDCAENFVPTRPEMWSPYTLDLSRTHDVALLHEICAVLRTNQGKVFKVMHATFAQVKSRSGLMSM